VSLTTKVRDLINCCADNGASYEFTDSQVTKIIAGENEQLRILADLYVHARTDDQSDYLFDQIRDHIGDIK